MAQKFYNIMAICKDNIVEAFRGHYDFEPAKVRVNAMKDWEMKYLAKKLADDYVNQLFLDSLMTIFEERFLAGGSTGPRRPRPRVRRRYDGNKSRNSTG